MNEQTRNEIIEELARLKTLEESAWQEYKHAEDAMETLAIHLKVSKDPLAEARATKEEKNRVWHDLNRMVEGLKVLVATFKSEGK